MPSLTLSWDLIIVVFFAVIMSYVFMVGSTQAVRLIVATYIAVIATEGLAIVLGRLIGSPAEMLSSIGMPADPSVVSLGKVFCILLGMLVVLVRSGLEVSWTKGNGSIMRIIATTLLGFSAAGLIASAILAAIAGSGILGSIVPESGQILPSSTSLTELLIGNRAVWYALPAFVLIVLGLAEGQE